MTHPLECFVWLLVFVKCSFIKRVNVYKSLCVCVVLGTWWGVWSLIQVGGWYAREVCGLWSGNSE